MAMSDARHKDSEWSKDPWRGKMPCAGRNRSRIWRRELISELWTALGCYALGICMCLSGKGVIPLSTKEYRDEVQRQHGKRIFRSGLLSLLLGTIQLISYLR